MTLTPYGYDATRCEGCGRVFFPGQVPHEACPGPLPPVDGDGMRETRRLLALHATQDKERKRVRLEALKEQKRLEKEAEKDGG